MRQTVRKPTSGQSRRRTPYLRGARTAPYPRDLETVLMKCLERNPNDRYASAAEVRDDLQGYWRSTVEGSPLPASSCAWVGSAGVVDGRLFGRWRPCLQ